MNRELWVIFTWLLSAALFSIIDLSGMHIIDPTEECHTQAFTFECATGTSWQLVNQPTVLMATLNAVAGVSALAFFISVMLWLDKKNSTESGV